MQPPILVSEEDLVNFLSGTSIPAFVSEIPDDDLNEFTESMKQLATILGLDERIKQARIVNSMKMGASVDMYNTEQYKQLLRDWGFNALFNEESEPQMEMEFSDTGASLPGFARKAYDGILEPMVVLQTLNGEVVGNAIVTEVRYDTNNDDVLVTVCTDACNMVIYELEELEERFHPPKWVAKGFINESVRKRIMKYYGRD